MRLFHLVSVLIFFVGAAAVVMVGDAVVTGVFAGRLAGPRRCRREGADTHLCLVWLPGAQEQTYSVLKASPYLSALLNYLREFEGPEG